MSNIVLPKSGNKVDVLKEYAEYGNIKSNVKFEFRFDERSKLLDVIQENGLDDLVDGKNDAKIAIALMDWFCGHYKHGNPPGGCAGNFTPQDLMAFANKNDNRLNCLGLSTALAQLIRAYNIKAFHIICSPYENPFDDCHVVVCVYCESLGKHIMLDPSSNLYLTNKTGEIIGVDELRDILIAGEELTPNDKGTNWGMEGGFNLNDYCDYMAKNLLRIERYVHNNYGSYNEDDCVVLIPNKYMQNEAKNFDDETREKFITSREYFWQI
jgi:hypothetical protein